MAYIRPIINVPFPRIKSVSIHLTQTQVSNKNSKRRVIELGTNYQTHLIL